MYSGKTAFSGDFFSGYVGTLVGKCPTLPPLAVSLVNFSRFIVFQIRIFIFIGMGQGENP